MNTSRREYITLLCLTLMAFLVRLVMVHHADAITGDGVWYATLGKNLVNGNIREGLSTYWPPLYPLLIGLSSLVFPDLEFAGRFVSVLAGSLLCVPVYLLTREFYGRDVAVIGVILVVIYPVFILYSTAVLTESTYMLLLMTGMYVGWRALSSARRSASFITGIVFGACYLVRPEAIGYVGLITVGLILSKLYNRNLPAKDPFINALTLILGFLLFSMPYVFFIHHRTGRWMISEKVVATSPTFPGWRKLIKDKQTTYADILWANSAPSAAADPEAMEDASPRIEATVKPEIKPHTVSDRLKGLHTHVARVIFMFELLRKAIHPVFILLAALGLFRTRWDKRRAWQELYLILLLVSTISGYGFTSMHEERYLVPVLPIILLWSARGIVEFEGWLSESMQQIAGSRAVALHNRWALRAIVTAAVSLTLLPSMTSLIRNEVRDPRPVAAWIQKHTSTPPLIMATNPSIFFYAGGKHLYLPNEEYPVVIDYARRKKVDFIVIDERDIGTSESLRFLLDEQSVHPGLKLVYKSEKAPKQKILVFTLSDPT